MSMPQSRPDNQGEERPVACVIGGGGAQPKTTCAGIFQGRGIGSVGFGNLLRHCDVEGHHRTTGGDSALMNALTASAWADLQSRCRWRSVLPKRLSRNTCAFVVPAVVATRARRSETCLIPGFEHPTLRAWRTASTWRGTSLPWTQAREVRR